MSEQANVIHTTKQRGPLYGVLSLATGLIAAAGVTVVGLVSYSETFNPPDWVRVATMAPIPFALIASVAFGVMGFRRKGRGFAIAGLVVSAMATAAFISMVSVVSY